MSDKELIEQLEEILKRLQAMVRSGAYNQSAIERETMLRGLLNVYGIAGSFEPYLNSLPTFEEIAVAKNREFDRIIRESKRRAEEDGWNG